MSQRSLVVALILAPTLLFGQLSPNAVTVSVSQAASAPPSQVAFSLTVTSGFNKTLDQVVGALSGLGITAANLVSLSSPANLFALPSSQAQPGLQWTFQWTVPFSQQTAAAGSLTALQSTIGQNNTGLSLSFTVGGPQAATPSSQNCNLAGLFSSARSQAQSLASAAGLTAGSVAALTGSSSACVLTVSFALNSASFQPTVNTITIGSSQTNTLPLDQATMVMAVTSGLATSLDDITGALQGAGITGASFSGVNTAPYLADGPTSTLALQWSFTLVASLSKLNATLTQLANAEQAIQQQSTGLTLTFYVLGLSSSQAQQPLSCPDASLVAEAQTQAQQVATAAAVSLGPIQAMLGSQNLNGSSGLIVADATTAATSTGLSGILLGVPAFSPASVCSIVVQYQLLY